MEGMSTRLPRAALPAYTPLLLPRLLPSRPPLQFCSSMCPVAPVGVWPFSGLCLPPPCGGRAEGNTFLIVSLPFMGCQGAEAAAPLPFPLRSLVFILISSQAPLEHPHPACPTDALQMGARRPARPQPLPALDFLQPRAGAF